jgi:hypothetical protein
MQIALVGPVLTDRPQLTVGDRIAAITQRHCAQALSSIWKGSEDPRADYMYWYWRWNGDWGSYGHAESLTEEEQARLRALAARLEEHPYVRQFVPED